MTDLLCYDCLTEDRKEVPAVTMHKGNSLCAKCAREWAEHAERMRDMARGTARPSREW